ncbi:HAUS augmin-like complex subunit 3 [Daphnia carinata]|uniref:HAUS augmin-like complex subunit 3 n=1 Tax=Daphnia carinata TaxID=120202 RepID=UPI00257AC1A3|nr:HAUS augmin-like complex subunit 3 [Daphnia carinata]
MAEHGKSLFQKLSEFRYPTINKYNPSSFDWLFDIEEALPFLDWLCSNVKPSNLLSSAELKQFECLEKEKFTVLEGKRLIEASNTPPGAPVIAGLETELQELQKIKDNLLIQRQLCVNQLNICNTKAKRILREIADFDSTNMDEEAKDQNVLSKLKSKEALANETLLSVYQTSSNIMKFLREEKLLCQHSFKQYLFLEEECTASLTNYANRQFEQNMGQMGQNSGLEICAFLQIGQNDFGCLLDLDEKRRSVQNWELNWLQHQLPLCEEDRIVNETEVLSLRNALDLSCQIFSALTDGRFASRCLVENRNHPNSLEPENLPSSKELASLKNCVVNSISKATHLRFSSIIIGDCSLKLIRQEYFLVKQKGFLCLLVEQWAREQLVLLALRLEGQQMKTLLSALQNVSQYLSGAECQLSERTGLLNRLVKLEDNHRNRNTIPKHDEISCTLKMMLGLEYKQENVPIDYGELSHLAILLENQYNVTKLHVGQHRERVVSRLKDVERQVVKLENLLFEGPLTCGTQKFTNLSCVKANLDSIDILREDVQKQLRPRNREFKIKLAVFKSDYVDALERKLWVLFYVDVKSMICKTEALLSKASLL